MYSPLPHQVERAILALMEDLASPVSLKVSCLIKAREWDQIANLAIDPLKYLDPESYWRDATAVSILRKWEQMPTSFDRKAIAEENFLSCEEQCFKSNLRLLPYLSPGLPDTEIGVHAYFERVRKICTGIIGDRPPAYVEGRFGPGSTFGDRGDLTTIPDKISSSPTITPDAWPYHFQWTGTIWAHTCASSGTETTYVQGNRFTTVPKDCKKDRGIAVEPSINLFYQLGYGRALRSRLKSAGINLQSGQETHARVARDSSITGDLVTMDLSSASDTICSNLVKLVLPPLWFEALNDLRSKKTLFRNKWRLLEKFSSMGNGFTFELETLIFLCLILAVPRSAPERVVDYLGTRKAVDVGLRAGKNVFVYGDDIICPRDVSNAVISVLEFCGCTINRSKTFLDGPFRESCGGDFYQGVDVRPYFLKETPCEPQQLIALANGLRASSEVPGRSRIIRRAWFGVLDAIPTHIRECRGPKDLGDLVIHDVECRWIHRWRGGVRRLKCYRPAKYRKVSWQNFKPDVVLASAVYGVFSGGKSYQGLVPRDGVAGYKIGWVPYTGYGIQFKDFN